MPIDSLHLLLTYRCTYACDHCFVWGSPRASTTMTMAQVLDLIEAGVRMGSVRSIYFEGGEPFLAFPLLVAGARAAVARGLQFGVVTNAYWATTVEDARLWLEPLATLGISDLTLSEDCFHGSLPSPQVAHALAAAKELGVPQLVLHKELPPQLPGGAQPATEGNVRLRGRAARRLSGRVGELSWESFARCPYEDLANPARIHIDAEGYVHLCQGLTMGRLQDMTLDALVAAYRPTEHPVVGPLLSGGPAELVRRYGLPHRAGYGDACHLCYSAREALRERFPEYLGPGQMYGENDS